MGFQPGNKFGAGGRTKEKQFLAALDTEIKAAPDERGLRVIARKLLDLAVDGDLTAIREVANRFDGTPTASLDIDATFTDISEQERRARLLELLIRAGTSGAFGPSGEGKTIEHQEQPEGVRPVH